jgi:hypothetical protein
MEAVLENNNDFPFSVGVYPIFVEPESGPHKTKQLW